jgi:chain length determinant protein EpsF
MTFQQFYLILRARWIFALCVFGAVIISAAVVTLMLPKLYTATTSVVVDVKADPIAMAYPTQQLASDIATQVDIIGSDRVAQRVVKLLKLDEAPDIQQQWQRMTGSRGDVSAWIADGLLKKLVVTPSKESNVIRISVNWPDPKDAAALANAFAQAYIDTNIELKVDPAKQYATWFNERSRALRVDLEAKQRRLSDFQSASGIVATDERLDVENARLAELSTQLVTIQAQRQDSQSRQMQASGDTGSLPEVLQSPVIQNLKAELARAEAKRQDIGANLGKNHPDYKDAEAAIAGLSVRIEQESAQIAASLGGTTQVNVRRENDIKAALEAQKRRMLELRHQHDEAADMQNDVTTAQRNLDAVTQRLAQSTLESQMQQTNIALLTSASEPLEPSSPRFQINLLLGLFLGTVLGVGAALLREMLDRRVRQGDELVELLGVPLIGRIPDAKGAKRKSYTPYVSRPAIEAPAI